MSIEYTPYDRIRYELFEGLLPRLIYEDAAKGDAFIFTELKQNGNTFLFATFHALCEDEGISCPYRADDFSVDVMKKGRAELIQMNLPPYNREVSDIVRAYLILEPGGIDDIEACYFLVKRFLNGHTFLLHIPKEGKGTLGPELTGHEGDMDYEESMVLKMYVSNRFGK